MEIRTKVYFINAGNVITGAIIDYKKNERTREYISLIMEDGRKVLQLPLNSFQGNSLWMICTDEKVDKEKILEWFDISRTLKNHFFEVYVNSKHYTAFAPNKEKATEAVINKLKKGLKIDPLEIKTHFSKYQIQALNKNIIQASS
jgi:hypothetical protein